MSIQLTCSVLVRAQVCTYVSLLLHCYIRRFGDDKKPCNSDICKIYRISTSTYIHQEQPHHAKFSRSVRSSLSASPRLTPSPLSHLVSPHSCHSPFRCAYLPALVGGTSTSTACPSSTTLLLRHMRVRSCAMLSAVSVIPTPLLMASTGTTSLR